MRDRVARLRAALLGSTIFLLLMIAGFIGYARYLRHHWSAVLPEKLGIDVKSDSSGVTLSQYSDKLHRTLYTIHAAKQTEFKNGMVALHGVSMTLYGQRGDRADRIYGDRFEYDQNTGVVRAQGVVHIDLQAAPKSVAGATGATDDSDVEGQGGAKVMHVTTSDLVYVQKLGVAATKAPIEFESGTLRGHATGADYNSGSGLLILHSAVSMTGVAGDRPLNLTASSAQFDSRTNEAILAGASYESEGRSAKADHATLYRRQDGTLQRVTAEGNVTVGANGGVMEAPKADVELNGAGQPKLVVFTGGVLYASDEQQRQVRGAAEQARISFLGASRREVKDAVFTGGAHMVDREQANDGGRLLWKTRRLAAETVKTWFTPAAGQSQLRDAEASGGARLDLTDEDQAGRRIGPGESDITADDLKAHMAEAATGESMGHLETLQGWGHTVVRQVSAQGEEQISRGDMLSAKFRPAPEKGGASAKPSSARGTKVPDQLWSALQEGHVSWVKRTLASTSDEKTERASAQRAAYSGTTDQLTLSGDVQLTESDGTLWAHEVTVEHESGNAHASGGVKAEYQQQRTSGKAEEPVHILAQDAELEHSTQIVTFRGSPARMWQTGSQIQAPVIEIEQQERRLIARGVSGTGWNRRSGAAQVLTVLANSSGTAEKPGAAGSAVGAPRCSVGSAAKGGSPGGNPGGRPQVSHAQAARIASGGVIYSDLLGEAKFTGGVRIDTPDATVIADDATAYLQPRTSGDASGVPSLNAKLDRMVASGNVDVAKPGIHATGDRLVYTSGDRIFLLTGTEGAPPRAVGSQGTVTGAALRLNSCDDTVEAVSQSDGLPQERVHTEMQVRDESRKAKGK